jgi:LysR family hydrogen peroxide-inducible transcriptional activator
MNIRDLKYLISLSKHQNFAKSALESNVSQPALSMQIKKLEDELGIKIFERDKQNFLITKTGEKIIEKAKQIILLSEEIKKIAKNAHDPFANEIHIGAFPTLASYFFPKIINKINRKFKDLKIFLVEEKSEILIKKLQDGEIDIAFLAMPSKAEFANHEKIFSENFLLATPLDHPLAKKKKIHYKDMIGLELMLLIEGHCLHDQALQACNLIGAIPKTDFKASSLETLRQMVIMGTGITLIPEIAVNKNDKIAYLPIIDAPKRTIGCYFRKSAVDIKLIKEIIKLSKEFL